MNLLNYFLTENDLTYLHCRLLRSIDSWYEVGYTFGMKIAISVPDELFSQADKLARRLKQPRSRLYAAAMNDFLKKHAGAKVTLELDDVYGQIDSSLDPAIANFQTKSLPKDRW